MDENLGKAIAFAARAARNLPEVTFLIGSAYTLCFATAHCSSLQHSTARFFFLFQSLLRNSCFSRIGSLLVPCKGAAGWAQPVYLVIDGMSPRIIRNPCPNCPSTPYTCTQLATRTEAGCHAGARGYSACGRVDHGSSPSSSPANAARTKTHNYIISSVHYLLPSPALPLPLPLPLPLQGADYAFHATSPEFKGGVEALKGKLQPLLLKLLSHAHGRTGWTVSTDEHLDEDERTDALADATDMLLESVDMAIDQSKMLRLQPRMVLTPGRLETAVTGLAASGGGGYAAGPAPTRRVALMHAQNVRRPQLSFADPIDNSEAVVFVPKLRTKPNATVLNLKASLMRPGDGGSSAGDSDGDGDSNGSDGGSSGGKEGGSIGGKAAASDTAISPGMSQYIKTLGIRPKPGDLLQYPHPYGPELHAWEPSDEMCTAPAEQMYGPVGETPLSWVETEQQLAVMAAKLDAADIFAIDLEAHSYRTYASFTCLMQISTRTEDFVVDTLSLRSHLQLLNSSFTNPKVVKVLHGSDSDINWLQKDLGLYLVGMFDTYQAAQVLSFPRKSLAHLLKHYCNVSVNKAYQLADWRIRPLSAEMLNYAREDTHYLLYVYDRPVKDMKYAARRSNYLHAASRDRQALFYSSTRPRPVPLLT